MSQKYCSHSNMLSLSAVAVTFTVLFFLEPLARYVWDPKNLRRFHNQNLLSGITNFGYIIERCRGFRSKNLHRVHRQHPVVRVGPNSVSFSTPDAIRAIYGHSTACLKGDMYTAPAGPHASLLDVVDKSEHARKRQYMSHAFATRNLQNWEFKITDKVQRLLRQFDKVCEVRDDANKPSTTIDFRKWSNLFTVEAIIDIALSRHLGLLELGDDLVVIPGPDGSKIEVHYIECLHAQRRATSTLVWATSWFTLYKRVLMAFPGPFRTLWRRGQEFDRMLHFFVRERVERAEKGEELNDLIDCILLDKKSGESRDLDMGEIEAEVSVLSRPLLTPKPFYMKRFLTTSCAVDAGSDTTAIALNNIMYFLLRTPKALSRLREEVDAALDPDTEVASYDRVKSLPYLRACLDESMRLIPPVSFGLHRKTPPEGAMIDGHWIAGNTTVAVPAYSAHRNETLFPDPEEFLPERWLGEDGKEAQSSFIPFSTGSRGCIGRNISYIEQSMLMATLVRRYNFSLPDETWAPDWEEAFNLWPGPMPLTISHRIVPDVSQSGQ